MTKPIKRMVYTNNMHTSEILYSDTYKGLDFYVVSYGTHPCCYIGMYEDDKNYNVDYSEIDLNVHGGLTYSGNLTHLPVDHKKWWIGWDYAHVGDRFGEYYQSGHTWKTTELIKECIQAIDEIRGDNNGKE